MTPRLKVFSWSDGFHAHTVAVSSRPKALDAWGVQQDLFQSGLARELTSGPDYDAAMAAPGEVVRRGEAVDIGKVAVGPGIRKPSGPSAARKARIARLEAELDALDIDRQAETAQLRAVRAALEQSETEAATAYESARDALRNRLRSAREGVKS